ncbi:MAG: BamA/TamA family outer membrane protein, partial [Candidatus Eisenbacteria bacterium]|nr:BamA/TamA family outer membrane protein [Candidatus Eisenbacteria bacterium]
VPLGVFNLRGALFTDFGTVWDEGGSPRLWTQPGNGPRRLEDLRLSFGTGIRTAVYFLLIKVDAAWRTDLVSTSKPRWHFSIGPEF